MNLKGKLIFGKQQLVLNSSKNKFCYNEEEKITESNNINNNEDIKSSNSSTIFNKSSHYHWLKQEKVLFEIQKNILIQIIIIKLRM